MGPSFRGSPRLSKAINGSRKYLISPRSPLSPSSSKRSSSPDSPYAGYHFLRLAQTLHMSGKKNAFKAMHYALKAVHFFENSTNANVRLELVMSLHLLAATNCKLGQYEEAIATLKRSLTIYSAEMGSEHAFGAFAGPQNSEAGSGRDGFASCRDLPVYCRVSFAEKGHHTIVAENLSCNTLFCMEEGNGEHGIAFLDEAMQFSEAEELCQHALKIHIEQSGTGSEEEIADRRLMALILSGKGNHETALDNLALARLALLANGKEVEVAFVDVSIGDTYLALDLYDEAVIAYQKALPVFKWVYGEGHTRIAALFVSLAELYMKMGKLREAKIYCENALKIYGRQGAAHSPDEIATGLTEVAGLFETMGEHEHALCLFQRALEILEKIPGQQSEVAGIEAQMGVLFYMTGKYEEAYMAFKSAVCKLRFSAQKKTWFLGMLLNQMGLACVGLNAIWDATEIFEEAKSILVEVCGPRHADTLAISSNLAGAYDALGRLHSTFLGLSFTCPGKSKYCHSHTYWTDDAIRLLEDILEVNEGRLGTVHPDVEEERLRLKELLHEAGKWDCISQLPPSCACKTGTLTRCMKGAPAVIGGPILQQLFAG
eukprot:Gb_03607 [translate_table: standard]